MLEKVYAKTNKGRAEIATRQFGVPARIRALLLMIDGERSIAALASKLGSPDQTGASMIYLLEGGFVALVATVPEPPVQASVPAAAPPAVSAPVVAPVSMHDIYSSRARH